ncbi:MAG TPA: hypothetical protein DCO75_02165, partial [Fibrobacteres bacterium]|nr:hypothetical protein [Fibrobacterota bacterium]
TTDITTDIKKQKKKYGDYQHVLLSDKEYEKLNTSIGSSETNRMIRELDDGIELHGYKYKNHYLAILKWKSREQSKISQRWDSKRVQEQGVKRTYAPEKEQRVDLPDAIF